MPERGTVHGEAEGGVKRVSPVSCKERPAGGYCDIAERMSEEMGEGIIAPGQSTDSSQVVVPPGHTHLSQHLSKTEFRFIGRGLSLLWLKIYTTFLKVITLWLWTPWAICRTKRWYYRNTFVNGRRLKFDGRGRQLFPLWLGVQMLKIITLFIFASWGYCWIERWVLGNVFFEDEMCLERGRRTAFAFQGGGLGLFWLRIWTTLLVLITLGLWIPWMKCRLFRWFYRNVFINECELDFTGRGGEFFPICLGIGLLTSFTLFLYLPWGQCWIERWALNKLEFAPVADLQPTRYTAVTRDDVGVAGVVIPNEEVPDISTAGTAPGPEKVAAVSTNRNSNEVSTRSGGNQGNKEHSIEKEYSTTDSGSKKEIDPAAVPGCSFGASNTHLETHTEVVGRESKANGQKAIENARTAQPPASPIAPTPQSIDIPKRNEESSSKSARQPIGAEHTRRKRKDFNPDQRPIGDNGMHWIGRAGSGGAARIISTGPKELLKGSKSITGSVPSAANPFTRKSLPEGTCSKCGKELESGWARCPYCLQPVASSQTAWHGVLSQPYVSCPNCGEKIEPDWKRCPHCLSVSALSVGLYQEHRKPAYPQGKRPYEYCAKLVVGTGSQAGVAYLLTSGLTKLGRGSGNQVMLDDPTVSAVHAEITAHGQTVILEDLDSTNGTLVNGIEVRHCRLRSGDEIAIGDTVLTIEF